MGLRSNELVQKNNTRMRKQGGGWIKRERKNKMNFHTGHNISSMSKQIMLMLIIILLMGTVGWVVVGCGDVRKNERNDFLKVFLMFDGMTRKYGFYLRLNHDRFNVKSRKRYTGKRRENEIKS